MSLNSTSIRTCLTIVLAVFLLQCFIVFQWGLTPYPDTLGFISLANDALASGSPYPSLDQLHTEPFIWNIGAINIIELSLWLCGAVWPVMVLYALMRALTAWLVYDITRQLFGGRAAIISIILYAVYPAIYDSTSLLSEPPFIFLSLLSFCLTLRRHAIGGGIVMALANWMRPMALPLLAAYVMFLILSRRKRYKKAVVQLIGSYVISILFIGGCCWLRTGSFIYQAQTGWMSLLQFTWDNTPLDERRVYEATYGDPNIIADTSLTASERDAVWRERCVDYILKHPSTYVRLMPGKVINTFVSDNITFCTFLPDKSTSAYMYDHVSLTTLCKAFPRLSWVQWLTLANLLFYYALLLSFIVVMIVRRHHWRTLSLPFLAVALSTLLLMLVGHGEARFHQPLMPFIIIAASLLFVRPTTQR